MKWVLKILRKHGLADAQSVCIDATTLEANASMKSLGACPRIPQDRGNRGNGIGT
jgi:hypothetical protein